MSKSRDAFRTISEVSDVLDTPAHVLRFWESKFSQVKPVKRAGGRRYYRPGDVDLLAGIKQLLHDDGMTIKGAQKLLREQGVKHVAAIGNLAMTTVSDVTTAADPVDVTAEVEAATVEVETKSVDLTPEPDAFETQPQEDTSNVVPLASAPEPSPSEDDNPSADVPSDETPSDTGPALTLDLGHKPEPEPQIGPEPVTTTTQAPKPPAPIFVPNDPADSDSKAPARLFHLLQHAPSERLAAQAKSIAPLLQRMQVLRDGIAAR